MNLEKVREFIPLLEGHQ